MVLNENEFEELMDEITHRFSKANIDGTLKALLEKLGWGALLASDAEPLFTFENGKILVIGEQTVGIDMLRMTAKKAGFELDRFEFMLDYEKAQTFVYSKLAYKSDLPCRYGWCYSSQHDRHRPKRQPTGRTGKPSRQISSDHCFAYRGRNTENHQERVPEGPGKAEGRKLYRCLKLHDDTCKNLYLHVLRVIIEKTRTIGNGGQTNGTRSESEGTEAH